MQGLIVVSMARTDRVTDAIRGLNERGIPHVMVAWTAGDDVPLVGLDRHRAGELAGRRLIAHDRRRIGYIGGAFGNGMFERRASRGSRSIRASFTSDRHAVRTVTAGSVAAARAGRRERGTRGGGVSAAAIFPACPTDGADHHVNRETDRCR